VIKFTLFFLSLSLLILLHEFGHYITARWFKARVDKFYLFFDFLFPFPNVLKFSLFKKKKGDTEYGIGWFPFGGYVDIAGMMADENGDTTTTPQPHEFRGKKAWQRLIILAGGITVNFLLAIVIYSMMMWAWGEDVLPAKNAKYGVICDSLMIEQVGMQNGDKIISVDNKPVENLAKISSILLLDKPKTIQVERNGEKIDLKVPADLADQALNRDVKELLVPSFPFVIDSVVPGTPADKAKFQPGDSLVALNGDTLFAFYSFSQRLTSSPNKTMNLTFVRNGEYKTTSLTLSEDGTMGVKPMSSDRFLKINHIDYGFFGAWGRGMGRTMEALGSYIKQFRLLFSKAGASKIGGFGSIASVFPSEWDWQQFWGITAYISVILAFMNLLPIPMLDGGYILFILWEMITGKKPSDKFMARALNIGMVILLALLVFANGNDILRALKK
jgi:regulator of sigma E protease